MEIKVFGKRFELGLLRSKINRLQFNNILTFLSQNNIQVYRSDIIKILKLQLDGLVDDLTLRNSISMEFQRRLAYYENFTLFQLINLTNITVNFSQTQFKEDFINYLLVNKDNLGFRDFKIGMLLNEALHAKGNTDKFNLLDLFTNRVCVQDKNGEIDGISIDCLAISLVDAATQNEVIEFSKYIGFEVPRRLKKEQLKDLIFFAAGRRGIDISNKILDSLNRAKNVELEHIADYYDLPCRVDLKKEGMYEYILQQKVVREGYIEAYKPEELDDDLINLIINHTNEIKNHQDAPRLEITKTEYKKDQIIKESNVEINRDYDYSIEDDYVIKFTDDSSDKTSSLDTEIFNALKDLGFDLEKDELKIYTESATESATSSIDVDRVNNKIFIEVDKNDERSVEEITLEVLDMLDEVQPLPTTLIDIKDEQESRNRLISIKTETTDFNGGLETVSNISILLDQELNGMLNEVPKVDLIVNYDEIHSGLDMLEEEIHSINTLEGLDQVINNFEDKLAILSYTTNVMKQQLIEKTYLSLADTIVNKRKCEKLLNSIQMNLITFTNHSEKLLESKQCNRKVYRKIKKTSKQNTKKITKITKLLNILSSAISEVGLVEQ